MGAANQTKGVLNGRWRFGCADAEHDHAGRDDGEGEQGADRHEVGRLG